MTLETLKQLRDNCDKGEETSPAGVATILDAFIEQLEWREKNFPNT